MQLLLFFTINGLINIKINTTQYFRSKINLKNSKKNSKYVIFQKKNNILKNNYIYTTIVRDIIK